MTPENKISSSWHKILYAKFRDQQTMGEKVVTPIRNDGLISLILKQASKSQEEKDQQKNVESL